MKEDKSLNHHYGPATSRLLLLGLLAFLSILQSLSILRSLSIFQSGENQSFINTPRDDVNIRMAKSLRFEGESDGEAHNEVCSYLKRNGPFSLDSLWQQELDNISAALLHSPVEDDKDLLRRLEELVNNVLSALPPSRLRRSLRPQSVSPEFHFLKIRRILNILSKRYRKKEAPKLNILVFGGSPTIGSNCERKQNRKEGRCAWPGHLEDFANAFLGFDGVNVVNFGMGASSSEVASMMLKFRLFPSSMPDGPDIIINAYSVNDFSYVGETDGYFQTLFENFVESTNGLRSCDGSRALVIYLDDFVINYKKGSSLQVGESYNAEIARLTQWYQVMTVGYSDVIRDMVYAGRMEEGLLVDWRGDSKHMPWGGHIAIVLSFAYNAMNSVLNFCDDEIYQGRQRKEIDVHRELDSKRTAEMDSIFRPPLDNKVSLRSVTDAWGTRSQSWNCKLAGQTCSFAWVAMRPKKEEMGHFQQIDSIVQHKKGWDYVTSWQSTKNGLYGKTNGVILLNVTDPTRPVNTVYLIYMKSYTKKWEGSRVEASVFLGSTESAPVALIELSGFHEKRTSEFFTEQLQFNVPSTNQIQGSVLLQLKMIGGHTFKIGGLSFCNSTTSDNLSSS
jgi:hypothetical protein